MTDEPARPEAQPQPEPPAGTSAEPEAEGAGAQRKPFAGRVLRGAPVAPGLILGHAHCKDYALLRAATQRVPLDAVEGELNRFHRALVEARRQLADLKARLAGKVPVDDARILDVHVAYLKDSVFISDVENLILNEQLALEASIAKVISDFDRIFRLVQNETLRERAVDLRDVGIRVLRHMDRRPAEGGEEPEPPKDYVLVARELSIVDMFNLSNEHVLGILTEEGGVTSHAAVLARSMRIPTITGIDGLLETIEEGDFVIVDATEGVVRINPDEVVVAQYRQASTEPDTLPTAELPGLKDGAALTVDEERIFISGACGNLPEVEQAVAQGLGAIGLYRTELMYLIDKEEPSVESLLHHYAAVLDQARGRPVTFRLLDVDSSFEVGYLHSQREQNPVLGRSGIRALLAHESVLRRQLQALMLAAVNSDLNIVVPFVTDCGELRRVREMLFEERIELRKTGQDFQREISLGVVIETPASVIGVRDLAKESDFVLISLDAMLQHLLAADRENGELSSYFESVHPFVLRSLRKVCEVCEEIGRPLSVFGISAGSAESLPLLVGAGLRRFAVAPVHVTEFLRTAARLDAGKARHTAAVVARGGCSAEAVSFVDAYRRGYRRD